MVSFKLQQLFSLKRCNEKTKNNGITGSCSLLLLNEFPAFHTIDCHVQICINLVDTQWLHPINTPRTRVDHWRYTVQLKCDGTRWRTGGKVKGKLANWVGSQYSSHYLGHMVYPALIPLMRTSRLPVVDWTDAHADLSGLVPFAERRNLFSARVPSHFKRSLLTAQLTVGKLRLPSELNFHPLAPLFCVCI